MKKSYLTAALMLTCLLGVVVSARAQDANAVVVSVPFEFVAGGATLPAGEYRIDRLHPDTNRELAIRGYGKENAFLLPVTFDGVENGTPALSFVQVGGKYFLSRIETFSGVYTMPASREMVMLGKANSPSRTTSSASGGQ